MMVRRAQRITGLAACATFLGSAIAFAEPPLEKDPKQDCIDSYESGQRLKRRGALLEARERLLTCAQPSCPEVVSADCTHFLEEIDADLPSVVLGAVDEAGRDLVGATGEIDGHSLAGALDGRSVPLDPGPHTFRFEAPGRVSVLRSVLIRQGEKNRFVFGELSPVSPPLSSVAAPSASPVAPARPSAGSAPWTAYALAGTGAGAVLGSALLFLSAKSQRDDLWARCRPNCSDADVGSVRSKNVLADVLLGAGLLSIGGATWLFLHPGRSTPSEADVKVAPLRGGASGSLEVSF